MGVQVKISSHFKTQQVNLPFYSKVLYRCDFKHSNFFLLFLRNGLFTELISIGVCCQIKIMKITHLTYQHIEFGLLSASWLVIHTYKLNYALITAAHNSEYANLCGCFVLLIAEFCRVLYNNENKINRNSARVLKTQLTDARMLIVREWQSSLVWDNNEMCLISHYGLERSSCRREYA